MERGGEQEEEMPTLAPPSLVFPSPGASSKTARAICGPQIPLKLLKVCLFRACSKSLLVQADRKSDR